MSGWFNLVLVLLAIVCLALLGIWQLGYDPIAHLSCLKLEDAYISVANTGKKIGRYYCVHSYSDSGKSCRSSTECEGDCLVSEQTEVESDGYYGKKVVDLVSAKLQTSQSSVVLRELWRIHQFFASRFTFHRKVFLSKGFESKSS